LKLYRQFGNDSSPTLISLATRTHLRSLPPEKKTSCGLTTSWRRPRIPAVAWALVGCARLPGHRRHPPVSGTPATVTASARLYPCRRTARLAPWQRQNSPRPSITSRLPPTPTPGIFPRRSLMRSATGGRRQYATATSPSTPPIASVRPSPGRQLRRRHHLPILRRRSARRSELHRGQPASHLLRSSHRDCYQLPRHGCGHPQQESHRASLGAGAILLARRPRPILPRRPSACLTWRRPAACPR